MAVMLIILLAPLASNGLVEVYRSSANGQPGSFERFFVQMRRTTTTTRGCLCEGLKRFPPARHVDTTIAVAVASIVISIFIFAAGSSSVGEIALEGRTLGGEVATQADVVVVIIVFWEGLKHLSRVLRVDVAAVTRDEDVVLEETRRR
jgi:hypothetical protein